MYSNGTALSIAVHQRILCPSPLVRTHAAPSEHLLHAVPQAIRKTRLAWGARRGTARVGYVERAGSCRARRTIASWRRTRRRNRRQHQPPLLVHVLLPDGGSRHQDCLRIFPNKGYWQWTLSDVRGEGRRTLSRGVHATARGTRGTRLALSCEGWTRVVREEGAGGSPMSRKRTRDSYSGHARNVFGRFGLCYLRRRSICFVGRPSYFLPVAREPRTRVAAEGRVRKSRAPRDAIGRATVTGRPPCGRRPIGRRVF